MFAVGLVRLTDPEVLRGIGRDLLVKFLQTFRPELTAKNIPLPDSQLPDDDYFDAVASLFASTLNFKPETPNSIAEALSAIAELSAPGATQSHCAAAAETGFQIHLDPGCSPEHAAVQVYLALGSFIDYLQQGGVTLDPLRNDGPDSLHPAGIPDILKVKLSGLETVSEDAANLLSITKADDLFQSAAIKGTSHLIPSTGKLTCAEFHFFLSHAPEPCNVQLRPPNVLKLDRLLDAVAVGLWIWKHGFAGHPVAT